MSAPKKICLITNRYPAHPDDVASPFVRDFHLGLKKRGADVSVFTPFYHTERSDYPDDLVRFQWHGGRKVVGSLNLLNPGELFQLFSFFRDGKRQLLQHLEKTEPDCCLALWALPSGWFAYQAKKEFGIPYSVWCLGSDIYVWAKRPFLRGITKRILLGAEHLFADGFDLKEKTEKLSGKRCLFLPSMRKLPHVSDGRVNLDPEKLNFLYLGRWEKSKGIDDLLKALSLIKNQQPSVKLSLVGWGGFEKRMRKLVERLGLDRKVKIVGKVSAESVAGYIKAADCVIIPSRGDSIPLVFSEALQMGRPLIVTDIGDMGYLTKRFRLGKVVPPGDVRKLAQAMIEFASQKNDYAGDTSEALKLLDIDRAVEDYLRTAGRVECSHTRAIPALSRRESPVHHDP